MDKLINKTELINDLKKDMAESDNWLIIAMYMAFIVRLTSYLGVDAVEVVRCKDCKYMCHYTDGHLECRLLSDLKPIPTTYCTMNADDFCSYGERIEDGKIH